MRMTRFFPALISGLIFLPGMSTAQRGPGTEDIRGPEGAYVSYEAVVLPGPSLDTFAVDVHYRIQKSFFVFLRRAPGQVQAQGEVLVELVSKDGAATAREVRTIQLDRPTEPAPGEILEDFQDRVRFLLPSGTYTIIMEVRAFESERRFLERRRTLEIGDPAVPSLLPKPIFGYIDRSRDAIVVFNRGGGVRFGSSGGMIVHVRTGSDSTSVVSWKLKGVADGEESTRAEYQGSDTVKSGTAYSPERADDLLLYRTTAHEQWGSAFIRLPLERLEPGPYTIDVTLTDGQASVQRMFRLMVVWPDRPISLSVFDVAVDALRHIASAEEIDDMVGFFADGGNERFREFWRHYDDDTSTAYIPAQEQYYRRVDDAIRRFSTRGNNDGYKTDRGRILILFGTPSTSQRIFKPNTGPREIWVYEQLKKRFIFTDPGRTGDYTLSQTEDL